jgi:hypothetical protein
LYSFDYQFKDSAFLDAKRLEVLKMRHNRIRHLTAGQLKGLYSLYKIDLFDNLIETLGGDMFIDSPLLKYIDLSSNTKLKHICRSTFIRHEYLEEVNLRNNIRNVSKLQVNFFITNFNDKPFFIIRTNRFQNQKKICS